MTTTKKKTKQKNTTKELGRKISKITQSTEKFAKDAKRKMKEGKELLTNNTHLKKIVIGLDDLFGKNNRISNIEKFNYIPPQGKYNEFVARNPIVLGYHGILNEAFADYYLGDDVSELKCERDARETQIRIKKHIGSMKEGKFNSHGVICMAYVQSKRRIYRLDGKGRTFAYRHFLAQGGVTQFPITIFIYYVKTVKELSDLYNGFDQKAPVRSKSHQVEIANSNSGIEFLENHEYRRLLRKYQDALLYMEEKFLKGDRRYDESNAAHINIEFSDLLEEVDESLVPYNSSKHIYNIPAVLAVMLYIFYISDEDTRKAKQFWKMLIDSYSTGLNKKDPICYMMLKLNEKLTSYDANKKSPIPKINKKEPGASVCHRALSYMVARAWNGFILNDPVRVFKYERNQEILFPVHPSEEE